MQLYSLADLKVGHGIGDVEPLHSTGEPRAGEGDWIFILIGNWEGSFSDVSYGVFSETLLRDLCRMGECRQGPLGKARMERHPMFISKHNKTVWLH